MEKWQSRKKFIQNKTILGIQTTSYSKTNVIEPDENKALDYKNELINHR